MPERHRLGARARDGAQGLALAIAAGEGDHADAKHQAATSTVKSSVTGLARSLSHIARRPGDRFGFGGALEIERDGFAEVHVGRAREPQRGQGVLHRLPAGSSRPARGMTRT